MARARTGVGSGPLLALGVIVALLLVGGYLLYSQDTRRGTQYPPYSVLRTDDEGAALAYRLFTASGIPARVWDRPLNDLKQPGTLIFVAPTRRQFLELGGRSTEFELGTAGDFFPDELRALDDWVARGNTVVVFSRDTNDLFHGLGLITDEPKSLSGQMATPTQPSALAQGVESVKTLSQFGFKFGRAAPKTQWGNEDEDAEPLPSPLQAIPAEEWLTLFEKSDGGRQVPQVVAAARGKGLYVAVNDPYPAGNLGLPQADNARFLLNIARLNPPGGTIWFDEYHKRSTERSFVAYLRERELFPALIYTILLLGLVFWRTGVPFGRTEPLVADRRRDTSEYITALAELYRNARMNRDAVATVYADFRRRLVGALRMDGLADLAEVGRRYEQRTGRPAKEARQMLVEAEAALARERVTEEEALALVQRLVQLDEHLHRRPGGPAPGGVPPGGPGG